MLLLVFSRLSFFPPRFVLFQSNKINKKIKQTNIQKLFVARKNKKYLNVLHGYNKATSWTLKPSQFWLWMFRHWKFNVKIFVRVENVCWGTQPDLVKFWLTPVTTCRSVGETKKTQMSAHQCHLLIKRSHSVYTRLIPACATKLLSNSKHGAKTNEQMRICLSQVWRIQLPNVSIIYLLWSQAKAAFNTGMN